MSYSQPVIQISHDKKKVYMLIMDYTNNSLPKGFSAKNNYSSLQPGGMLTIFTGYLWDGPTGAINTDDFIRASLVHDVLCELIYSGLLSDDYQIKADKALMRMCIEDGMSRFRAWYVYLAVRAYQKTKRIFN